MVSRWNRVGLCLGFCGIACVEFVRVCTTALVFLVVQAITGCETSYFDDTHPDLYMIG